LILGREVSDRGGFDGVLRNEARGFVGSGGCEGLLRNGLGGDWLGLRNEATLFLQLAESGEGFVKATFG
jgi:hypothetical protein